MKLIKKRTKLAAIMAAIMLMAFSASTFTEAATVRDSDKKTASSGTAIIGVNGTYDKPNVSSLLNRINAIRKEACNEGVYCRALGRKLSNSDYVAISWDSSLEYIAQVRAAEADVFMSHNRPNETSTFTLRYGDKGSSAEVIAWNYGGILSGIEAWYDEKATYISAPNDTSLNTGHYAAMINPNYKSIGLAGFTSGDTATQYELSTYMGEFGTGAGDGKTLGASGDYIQKMEILTSNVSGVKITGDTSVSVGSSKVLTANCSLTHAGAWTVTTSNAIVYSGATWTSLNTAVATVDSNGRVTGKKKGTATIVAKLGNYQGSFTVNVLRDSVIKTTYKGVSGWYYLGSNDQVDTSFNGFASNSNGWWYLEKGKVNFNKSGIIKGTVDGTSGWWYVKKGQVIFTNTVAKNENGWWCIKNGKVDFSYTGIAKNEYGWWRIKNGKVDFRCNTVEKNELGWWKCKDGKVDFSCNTIEKNQNGWWKCKDGKVDFSFNGIASNRYGQWFCRNGKVDFKFSGEVQYDGSKYQVKDGLVKYKY